MSAALVKISWLSSDKTVKECFCTAKAVDDIKDALTFSEGISNVRVSANSVASATNHAVDQSRAGRMIRNAERGFEG